MSFGEPFHASPNSFKFRLYPDKKQEKRMLYSVETCRRLWNAALEDRISRWKTERRTTTYWQQCLKLTTKELLDYSLETVHSQSLQDVLRRLGKGYKAFFSGHADFPRFKKYRDYGSFTYPQAYNGSVKLDLPRKRIYLSKMGNVKAIFHKPLPSDSRLKTCTVKREPDGKWFACLVYEVPGVQNDRASCSWKAPVGIDLGLKSLITTSDGEKVEPPKFLRKAEKRIKALHRNLSKKRNGSKNRAKAQLKLAVQYSRVSNRRRDFNHKLSARLVRDHDLLAFEDLAIDDMAKNHSLAKSIEDASWGQLLEFSEYKSRRSGKTLVRVNPRYSTRECYFCGNLNQVSLDVREYACGNCGKVLDRDRNAARIVLKRGILQVGQDKGSDGPRLDEENPDQVVPELKPAEIGPLPRQAFGVASPVVEAGTTCGAEERSAAGNLRRMGGGGCHKAGALLEFQSKAWEGDYESWRSVPTVISRSSGSIRLEKVDKTKPNLGRPGPR